MKLVERFPDGVFLIDFEFHPRSGNEGNPPEPVCLVVREYISGTAQRYWRDKLVTMKEAPFPVGVGALCVAYFASAEMDCFLALGWRLPTNLLDLYCEFRSQTNGTKPAHGAGLIGALLYWGQPAPEAAHKEQMRSLILGGGPWVEDERKSILEYCQTDVDGLRRLLRMMYFTIDWPRALLRGRYVKAVSRMQAAGIPMDTSALGAIRNRWEAIQDALIAQIDHAYGVYIGRTFRASRWAEYLRRHHIPWPRLDSGALELTDDAFRQMARAYPAVAPIRELRSALSEMRLANLTVGDDGRNRCLISPFSSKTGRNQPSNTRFIFGPSVWLRGLIKPEPGMGVAYIDYCQQEFGIAGALSGDEAMMQAYRSGDPYLTFAKQAGAVPRHATKETHKAEREQFKQCVLAVQYGMGEASLANRIGQPPVVARRLLELHRRTYKRFWEWSDGALAEANLRGRLWTPLGWEIRVGSDFNPRSLRNFPMQATGAEVLRLACIYMTEAGVKVCAPVHDAVLIESPLYELDRAVAMAQSLMVKASIDVLGGFALSCDAKLVRYPNRFADERGTVMWDTVMELVGLKEPLAGCHG